MVECVEDCSSCEYADVSVVPAEPTASLPKHLIQNRAASEGLKTVCLTPPSPDLLPQPLDHSSSLGLQVLMHKSDLKPYPVSHIHDHIHSFPVAQLVEHGVSKRQDHGFDSQGKQVTVT